MSSLEETPGPEMRVSEKGDIQNVQCWGCPGPGLRNTDLAQYSLFPKISLSTHIQIF